ncbi:hypothetical protein CGLO_15649 [Colletotrichum gloeosporioides Cg-14]|uniref:Uncharacterized protein n=1 Tax=Colletotrichum gloeosporioides (strain Cg-14) TaxID=1237896 RepID=T0JQK1_COLGC|nr:hypothetical protein CGLO_15649 [Colletotrichum gloeosporioides Cg-14]
MDFLSDSIRLELILCPTSTPEAFSFF